MHYPRHTFRLWKDIQPSYTQVPEEHRGGIVKEGLLRTSEQGIREMERVENFSPHVVFNADSGESCTLTATQRWDGLEWMWWRDGGLVRTSISALRMHSSTPIPMYSVCFAEKHLAKWVCIFRLSNKMFLDASDRKQILQRLSSLLQLTQCTVLLLFQWHVNCLGKREYENGLT